MGTCFNHNLLCSLLCWKSNHCKLADFCSKYGNVRPNTSIARRLFAFGALVWSCAMDWNSFIRRVIRVFILTSLWKFSSNKTWMFIVIFIASVLIGLVHLSQGSYGIVTITVKSLVAGFFFCKYRRLLPLIVAHVLYDGLQVAVLLITYP